MPYLMKRDEKGLGLKVGDELECKFGELPAALKFSAEWKEPEAVKVEVKKPAKSKAK